MPRLVLPVLLLAFAATGCASGKPDWIKPLRPEETRFKIPVIQLPGATRDDNLRWSRAFAAEWTKRTGLRTFVDDAEIRSQILKDRKLIPSTNYAIPARVLTLGEQSIVSLSVQDLETGKILASGRIKGRDKQSLMSQVDDAVEALLR